ncbi:acyltransferase domain-containing protein [Mycobacteroides franklinii]|uniref:[acyl-carrier-protein] S-malonyltransferase n=1 Tax=Mycobacteroides franklinii TaxID=948102 RepID=A0A4R8QZM4_9MYCO|nr:acyltransferase domain-containing protein [Mycobacteroides franklinii]TDZ45781.1 Erythronolide synthase, modules 1 and 2 [Mycobacteroides franklinii]TDZ49271.1 Erythronolide synthase, modules 1 and 2 [Mycobacteroides franklinii]TDZ59451.1 Erythronolide synthase, modules 1 and 2 [Mycobacteroides franklinii]TDZ66966.1 Erythronolide synthase, modules 1 and 2 [Mycobacteroides franklinii]TDZ72890.1 Erythronolide synthase, modules 1 and 2 [Mycobacteroides franklinii]
MTTLVQFPGLGGYAPGMLAQLTQDAPRVAGILEEVDRVAADYGLGTVSGPLTDPNGASIEKLADTPTLLHLASYVSGYVMYQAMCARGTGGDMLLGHSTGEITALVAAGALSVADGARVLCEREVALAELDVSGGLVALAAGSARAHHLCGAAGGLSLTVSLSNSPVQTVISGTDQELPRLEAVARAAGVQATRLLVRYPHHNQILRRAADLVAEAAVTYEIADPKSRVYSPILGRFVDHAGDARRIIDRHLTDPVNYLHAIRTLYDDCEVRTFIEVGVRSVLTDSARESLPASVTLLGPPPVARSAVEILDILSGVTAPVSLRDLQVVKPPADTAGATNGSAPAVMPVNGSGAASLPSREALMARLRSLFAASLGYPEDVFTDDAHLEADLGIASVKKTELLVRLLDEFQLPTPPAAMRMRDYNTIPDLARLMENLGTNGASV